MPFRTHLYPIAEQFSNLALKPCITWVSCSPACCSPTYSKPPLPAADHGKHRNGTELGSCSVCSPTHHWQLLSGCDCPPRIPLLASQQHKCVKFRCVSSQVPPCPYTLFLHPVTLMSQWTRWVLHASSAHKRFPEVLIKYGGIGDWLHEFWPFLMHAWNEDRPNLKLMSKPIFVCFALKKPQPCPVSVCIQICHITAWI